MSIETEIRLAMERIAAAMRAKGCELSEYNRASTFFGGTRWIVTARRRNEPDIDSYADTLAEAVDELLAKIADLPPRWTDADVAATLGIGAAA